MLYRVTIFLSLMLLSTHAYADLGDLAVGGQVGIGAMGLSGDDGSSSSEPALLGQSEVHLRVGLLDWLHLDSGLGMALFEQVPAGTVDFGLTMALDVFAVVPEFKLGLFLLVFEDGDALRALPGLDASLALRYHIDLNWSVAVGAELNAAIVSRYQGTLSFLYVLR